MSAIRSPDCGLHDVRPIPARAGIGLRAPHHQQVIADRPALAWVEVHSENFFAAGGSQIETLSRIRENYPLSLHGVGLGLGTSDPLNREHLESLRSLVNRFEPGLVSEHLCWGAIDGIHFNDLLPMPYTEEALNHVAERVQQVQDFLGRRILIENVSSYLAYGVSTMPEWEFLANLARRSGCGILLDVNNVFVSSCNLRFDPYDFIAGVPGQLVEEIHLAGHSINTVGDQHIYIDTHSAPVADAVWDLYAATCRKLGPLPTLIEWDTDIPSLNVLIAEAARADSLRETAHAIAA